MRILYFGAANSIHVTQWAEWFAAKGHDVYLVSFHPIVKQIKGVKQYYIGAKWNKLNYGKNPLAYIIYSLKYKKLLKQIKPDIIHTQYICTYGFVNAFCSGHPSINAVMGGDVTISIFNSRLLAFICKWTIKHCDMITVKDIFAKKRLMKLGAKDEQIIERHSFCDLDFFKRDKRVKRDKKTILFTRQWQPKYKSEVLMKAIPRLVEMIPNIKIVTFWRGESPESYLPKVVKMYPNNIIVVPEANRYLMRYWLNKATIYVDTYYLEPVSHGIGHGSTTWEAMACECPLLLPDRDEYDVGYFFADKYECGNSKDLADKVYDMLQMPGKLKILTDQNLQSVFEHGNRGKIFSLFNSIIYQGIFTIREWNKLWKSKEKVQKSIYFKVIENLMK
jgi:glycosyltransferase involved in cell wall biosynthesis